MGKTTPLSSTTWWLLRVAMVFCALTVAAALLGLAAVPVIGSGLDPLHLPPVIEGMARGDVLAFAAFVLAYGAVAFTLFFLVFRAAAAIVRTAIDGDPFVVENAGRLVRIGWLLITVQALGLATLFVYGLLPTRLREFYLDFGASPACLLAILVIFVLARIFRRGAEMRADLEGTV